jgi:hypothetical protein
MIERIKESFRSGVSRVKWFATVFAERMKVEIAVMGLLYRSGEMEKKKGELLRTIGLRVCELKGSSERNLLKDRTVIEAVEEVEKLEKEMEELKQRASEMSSVKS